jgi:hypothetical protein
MDKALDKASVVLNRLGERFPRRICDVRSAWGLQRCDRMLRCKSQKEILDLPILTDKKKLTAIRLMNIMFSLALLSSAKCCPALASRAVVLTLRYGLSELCKLLFHSNMLPKVLKY